MSKKPSEKTMTFQFDDKLKGAAKIGDVRSAEFLLRDIPTGEYRTQVMNAILHISILRGNINMVALLIRLGGVDVNQHPRRCHPPLSRAILHLKYSIAILLLRAGADPNALDCQGIPPLMNALQFDRVDIDLIKALISAGANVNIIQRERTLPPLPCSIRLRTERCDIVTCLLDAGAEINYNGDGCLTTPLHEAIYRQHTGIAKILVRRGGTIPVEYNIFDHGPPEVRKAFFPIIAEGQLRFIERIFRINADSDDSPVSLLRGFPEILKFIVYHCLPRWIVVSDGCDLP